MSFTREEADMLIARLENNRKKKMAAWPEAAKQIWYEDEISEYPHKKTNKHNAQGVRIDGVYFPSKIEGEYYRRAKQRVRAGELLYFLMQVPFVLPGAVRVRVDFMEVFADGRLRFVDVKGRVTASFERNRKLVKGIFGVDIVPVFYDYKQKVFYEKDAI